MEVRTATNDFFNYIKNIYPDVKVFSQNDYNKKLDLLIFTGGEDICPERYGEENKYSWCDEERDELEFKLINEILNEKIKVNKVLGFCRGIQLMNVAFGGTLFQDLFLDINMTHPSYHNIIWHNSTIFSEIDLVNSMHHQAINKIGTRLNYRFLAYEPKTDVIEAMIWDDKFLGVQFHPEFFPIDSEKSKNFFNGINFWIENNTIDKLREEIRIRGTWNITGSNSNIYLEENN